MNNDTVIGSNEENVTQELPNDKPLTAEELRRAEIEQHAVDEETPPSKSREEGVSLGQGGFGRVDEHSGTFGYNVPVFVPEPHHGGPGPTLSLVYNSRASGMHSFVAAGWRLMLGQIERNAPDTQTFPNFRNNQGVKTPTDSFILELNGQSYTLVRMQRRNERGQSDNNVFVAKSEGPFIEAIRYLKKDAPDPDSAEPEIDHWLVRTADGLVCRFGVPGIAGGTQVAGQLRNKVWHLRSIEDPYGRRIEYEYALSENSEFPDDIKLSRPTRVKSGMLGADNAWDSQVEFVYSQKGADPEFGFYEVKPESSTGRKDANSCFVWDRLEEINTYIKDTQGEKQLIRRIVLSASKNDLRVFQVDQIDELSYDLDGNKDKTATLPPHRFIYTTTGAANPAMMQAITEPLGRRMELSYGNASLIDEGDEGAKGLEGVLLVTSQLEIAGEQRWQKDYRYFNGLMVGTREYRGHQQVHVHDRVTGQYIETHLEMSGVHHGRVKHKIIYEHFDPVAKVGRGMISEIENRWMALDYGAGRFRPFVQRSVVRGYAEDGVTVLSTKITEIPEKSSDTEGEPPLWRYAVDQFGNVKEQIESIYTGPEKDNALLLRTRTTNDYFNRLVAEHRFVGLPTRVRKEAEDGSTQGQPQLLELTTSRYNYHGQEIEKRTFFTADKAQLTTTEYHPEIGKKARSYRYNGTQPLLEEELDYFESGPYRFLPRQEINAKGQAKQYLEYDLRFREPTLVVDIDGMVQQTHYDGLARPVEEVYEGHQRLRARGGKDSVQRIFTVTGEELSIKTIHVHTGSESIQYFDILNREWKKVEPGFQGRPIIDSETEYDLATREPKRVAEPHFADEPAPGYSEHEYDAARQRLTRIVHSNGQVERREHDGLRTITYQDVYLREPDGRVGNLLYTRVAEDLTKDAAGREVLRAQGKEGAANRYELFYRYDLASRPVEVSDNLGVSLLRIDYGARLDDKVAEEIDVSIGRVVTAYDGLGRLIEVRHGGDSGHIRRVRYDELDRIVHQTDEDLLSGSRREIENLYDGEPNGVGKLAEQKVRETSDLGNYQHRKQFFYDDFGYPRLEQQAWDIDWPGLGIKRELELRTELEHNGQKAGRLERITHPPIDGLGGGSVNYRYDDRSGLLIGIELDGQTLWENPEGRYTALDKIETARLGNGLTTHFDYEPESGVVNRIRVLRAATELVEMRLAHDSAGNVRQRTIRAADEEGLLPASDTRYGYDDKGQLVSLTEGDAEEGFDYLANGSRDRHRHPDGDTRYSYDPVAVHQARSLEGRLNRALSHDALGNVILDVDQVTANQRRFDWNPANKVQQAHILDPQGETLRQLCYGYGADDRRVLFYDSDSSRLVLYADDELEVEWGTEEGAAKTSLHVMNGDRRTATREHDAQAASLYYYYRDHLESVALVFDDDGRVAGATSYDPFGAVRQQSGSAQPNILFTGHRADLVDSHGFDHYDFGARLYDPVIGMFLSPDSEDDEDNAAFGHNRYVYVNNNPLSHIDPSGHGSWDLWNNPITDLVLNRKAGDFVLNNTQFIGRNTSNFAAGAGDVVSLGVTNKVRESMDTNSVVDKDSGVYTAGQVTGGLILAGNVPGLIKGGTALASKAAPYVYSMGTKTVGAVSALGVMGHRMLTRFGQASVRFAQGTVARVQDYWNRGSQFTQYYRALTQRGRDVYEAGQRTFSNAFFRNRIPEVFTRELTSPKWQTAQTALRGQWLQKHHPIRSRIPMPQDLLNLWRTWGSGPTQKSRDLVSRVWGYFGGGK
jgi:RHS repeat-associated protein